MTASRLGRVSSQPMVPDPYHPRVPATAPRTADRTAARITVYCICEGLERTRLESLIRIKHPAWETHPYSDVLHAQLPLRPEDLARGVLAQDVFFFEVGAYWYSRGRGQRGPEPLHGSACK